MQGIEGSTILVVDDTEANIDVLLDALDETYEVKVALDGATALEQCREGPPDLILLDIMMPGMDGYEVFRRLQQEEALSEVPVIFVTALNDPVDERKGLELGAVDYITKPFNPSVVQARVRNHLELKTAKALLRDENALLEHTVQLRTREVQKTQDVTIECLASLAETRDPETGNHIRRTQHYVKVLAERLQDNPRFTAVLDDAFILLLFKSTALHDVGKVGVPDHILLKPRGLTDQEFEQMKKHTVYGRDALLSAEKTFGDSSFLRTAADIAFSHHEKWDGSGYPKGLQGEAIPVPGRLMALADIYDALISKRVYKPAFSHEETVRIITQGDGRVMPDHFDPDLLQAFTTQAEQFRDIAKQFAD